MSVYYKSPVAAQKLGVPYVRLVNLVRYGRMSPPQKDSSGDYVWTEEDLIAARQALATRRRGVAES